jgi:signal transduction histidine kinase
MAGMWQRQAKHISQQAKFSMLTESKVDAKKIALLFNTRLISHVSFYAGNQLLFSSGENHLCNNVNPLSDSYIESEESWCFHSLVKDSLSNQAIGYSLLVVSKQEMKALIRQSLFNNIVIVTLLTFIILGFFYYLTKKLTSPLINLSSAMEMAIKGKRGLKINPEGTQDMRKIQKSFNLMMQKVERQENNLEEKVTERTLELSDAYKKAQGASQVKSDILKIVSHEMKTPLHSAMYYLHLMNSNDGYFVSEVIECLERLQTQINNFLDYSRAAENKVVLNKTLFSPSNLLEVLMNEFEPIFLSRNNQFSVNCNYKGTIYSDEQLIRQILINIIGNANKYTNHGTVTLTCANNDNVLDISVLDTGCGISEHHIKDIFKPFWQADMSSARVHEGTGLGLAICHLFAEAIGGEIIVESKINKGSVFTLRLPVS